MSNALRTVFKREIQPSEQADEALSTTPNTETEKSTPTEESKEGVLEPVDDTNKTPSKDEENKNTADAADAANVTTTNQTANELEKVDSPEQNSEVKKETEASNGETDDDSRYPSGTKLALLTFGLAMATFVIALDNTIIATAIPRITTDFDALNDVGWYGSSYLLTTTSLQPSFGKVYTYFDVKWVYLSALMIFELGSILCAAATGSTMLIVGRAVAGAGAAALFSGGMTIVG
jgi:hypothetical protein